ncbi:DUF2066 domain-containing protein [Maricaulis sp.]|uniref:DUF2066 domain-containing protein n=1 Tax=Maricaulis sp. TaxID=1486257 RepID=UPI003A8D6B4F
MRPIFAAICLFFAIPALASADDPYTILGVSIDATGSNALEAQTLAMRRGQAMAAQRLIERLTLPEDRAGTPLDFGSAGAIDSIFDDSAIAELISGLQIDNEQRSATRYLGELAVNFDRRAVVRLLSSYGVPFVESQARPTLVLPVYDAGGQFYLWDENPWLSAWTSRSYAHALAPMAVPVDGGGRAIISAREALGLDEARLRELASVYGVSRIAVLRAQEREGVRRMGGFLVSFDAGAEMVVDTWGPETVYGGWNDAALGFVVGRENAWKREAIVRNTATEDLRVTVIYGGLGEWQSLQGALTGASLVTNARLDAMSRDGALMTVSYRGALEQLTSELAERGAALEEHPGLGWVVRSAF